MVAVAEKPAEPAALGTAHQARPRTPDQQRLIDQHAERVRAMYAALSPGLMEVLLDETPLWTEDIVTLFAPLTEQRVYVLYSDGDTLAEAGYMIHPAGIPRADATGGMTGPHEIRGISLGRLALWALGAHRALWNPDTGFTWISPDSTESQVARSAAALENPKVPHHYRDVLLARVQNPDLTTKEIAERLGMSKAAYTSKLRRALETAERP